MKKRLIITISILLSYVSALSGVSYAIVNSSNFYPTNKSKLSKNNWRRESNSGELLIKLKKGSSLQKGSFHRLNRQYGIKKIKTIFGSPQKTSKKKSHPRWYKVSLPQNMTLQEISRFYKNCPEVEFVEPNYKYDICSYPNDPYYNTSGSWGQCYQDMWSLYKIDLPSGWEIEKGKKEVIIAVVDTGIDYHHEDIINNIWNNPNEIPNNGIDDDLNGYIDDIRGWNFVDNSNTPKDGHGHGSHLAGTIAGVTNNGKGISGISWCSQVMPIKGITDSGWGMADSLANGIKYAADNGAKIINLSWGGYGTCQILKEALDYAYSKGCILVAAAGNSNQDVCEFFPANYENAITVAATDQNDEKTFFSNYGTKIDIAAPGVDILSLKAEGSATFGTVGEKYCRMSGTSMSAPHVCGVAALILSKHPNYTNEEIASLIAYSADDLGEQGKDIYFGWGRINGYKALLTSDGILSIDKNLSVTDTPSDSGHSITISWTKNSYPGLKGYKIYYSLSPFTNLSQVTYLTQSPIANPEATTVQITDLGDESCGYYFSVIGNIFDYTTDIEINSNSPISTTEPIYPVNNIINTLKEDDTIIAGFDPKTKVIIPQGTSNNEKTLDIFKPNSCDFPNQLNEESYKSFHSYGEQESQDAPDELLSTIRELKTSSILEGKIKLIISYKICYSSSPLYAQENNLRIYQLNTIKNNWEIVSGFQKVDKESKVVTCEVENPDWQNGIIYRMFPAIFFSQKLNTVKVYPNPYKPNSYTRHKKIIFSNLTKQATIRIYNIAGEMVFKGEEEDSDGKYEWQATNTNGDKLASGIYIYLITNDTGEKKKGKIGIIK